MAMVERIQTNEPVYGAADEADHPSRIAGRIDLYEIPGYTRFQGYSRGW